MLNHCRSFKEPRTNARSRFGWQKSKIAKKPKTCGPPDMLNSCIYSKIYRGMPNKYTRGCGRQIIDRPDAGQDNPREYKRKELNEEYSDSLLQDYPEYEDSDSQQLNCDYWEPCRCCGHPPPLPPLQKCRERLPKAPPHRSRERISKAPPQKCRERQTPTSSRRCYEEEPPSPSRRCCDQQPSPPSRRCCEPQPRPPSRRCCDQQPPPPPRRCCEPQPPSPSRRGCEPQPPSPSRRCCDQQPPQPSRRCCEPQPRPPSQRYCCQDNPPPPQRYYCQENPPPPPRCCYQDTSFAICLDKDARKCKPKCRRKRKCCRPIKCCSCECMCLVTHEVSVQTEPEPPCPEPPVPDRIEIIDVTTQEREVRHRNGEVEVLVDEIQTVTVVPNDGSKPTKSQVTSRVVSSNPDDPQRVQTQYKEEIDPDSIVVPDKAVRYSVLEPIMTNLNDLPTPPSERRLYRTNEKFEKENEYKSGKKEGKTVLDGSEEVRDSKGALSGGSEQVRYSNATLPRGPEEVRYSKGSLPGAPSPPVKPIASKRPSNIPSPSNREKKKSTANNSPIRRPVSM
ncbi:hypothetical protein KR200_002001 [Drosophila serrata]|nr:hypothetical protein KR200_002001 [Drosophila serrata]